MAIILNIETATKNCSVSLAKNGELLCLKEINTGNYSHAEMLHPLIEEVLDESNLTISDLNAVAVGKGPGSYTGLRIGVSAAKGLCFANDIPMISLPSLTVLAQATTEEGTIIPLLDARRMEVYSAVFNKGLDQIRDTQAEIINEYSFSDYKDQAVILLGDGAAKCKGVLTGKQFKFLEDKFPSAREMVRLSYQKFLEKNFEDIAYFEPFYLKDFVATPEKKRKELP